MELSEYYDQICKQPLLTKEEESALLETIFNENESERKRKIARDKLLHANLRFVFKKAKRYARGDINQFEDLIAAGNEGLIIGLNKYDHNSGVRFLTYAGWWVMQRQLKEMSQWRIVSLPMQKQQLSTRIRKYVESRETQPTLAELKEEFPDASEKDLNELSKTQFLTFYIDDLSVAETPEINPINILEKQIDTQAIHNLINDLGYPDNHIATMAFGLDDGKPKNNKYIMEHIPDKVTPKHIKNVKAKVKTLILMELPGLGIDDNPGEETED